MKELSFTDAYPRIGVLDVETNGLDPKENKIIELGLAIYIFNGNKYEQKLKNNWLVKIDKPLEPKITEITNITDKMLEEEGIERSELLDILKATVTGVDLLMGYNAQFDLSFVYYELLQLEDSDEYLKEGYDLSGVSFIDVMAIVKDRKNYPHRLESALQHWGIELENTHRALDDALATYEVFKVLMTEKFVPEAYVNRFGWYKSINGYKFPHVTYVAQGLNGNPIVYNNFLSERKKKLNE